jgi:heptosyltransferase-2
VKKAKVLIVRFSSFGDIVQCSTVVELIRQTMTDAQIHWVTRNEFKNLVNLNAGLDKVIGIDKTDGFKGLLRLALLLRREQYTHVYDAHNNLRSVFLKLILMTRLHFPKLIVRSKERFKRILLFTFRINLFPKPFKGIDSYCLPLAKWGITNAAPVKWNFSILNPAWNNKKFITFVPSAAWEMKRWPLAHWKKLVQLLPQHDIVILGGKEDLFCEEISAINPTRVTNLAGKLSLIESCDIVKKSNLIVSADTGLLHVADVLQVPGISLMGPTAFGFTASNKIITVEVDLSCRPCSKDGRGKCSQEIYQKCMVDITPEQVASVILQR